MFINYALREWVWEGKAGASFNQIQKNLIKALSLSLCLYFSREKRQNEKNIMRHCNCKEKNFIKSFSNSFVLTKMTELHISLNSYIYIFYIIVSLNAIIQFFHVRKIEFTYSFVSISENRRANWERRRKIANREIQRRIANHHQPELTSGGSSAHPSPFTSCSWLPSSSPGPSSPSAVKPPTGSTFCPNSDTSTAHRPSKCFM